MQRAGLVFVDCKFTDLVNPEGLSLGMVTADGREFYVEVDLGTPRGKTLLGSATAFVADHVTPQFRRPLASVVVTEHIGDLAADWLLELGYPRLEVAYDYHADYGLLERWLQLSSRWRQVEGLLVPTHIGYLLGQHEAEVASAASWDRSRASDGVGRHHALADARALRAAFSAVHGGS